MGRKQRRYTDDEVAVALATLEACGGNVSRTARTLDMPANTIRNWRTGKRRVPPELVREKRLVLATIYEDIAYKAAGLISGALDHLQAQSADDALDRLAELNRVSGTATDKLQLLSGRPTERHEHVDMTPDEAVGIARRLRLLRGGKSA